MSDQGGGIDSWPFQSNAGQLLQAIFCSKTYGGVSSLCHWSYNVTGFLPLPTHAISKFSNKLYWKQSFQKYDFQKQLKHNIFWYQALGAKYLSQQKYAKKRN